MTKIPLSQAEKQFGLAKGLLRNYINVYDMFKVPDEIEKVGYMWVIDPAAVKAKMAHLIKQLPDADLEKTDWKAVTELLKKSDNPIKNV